MAILIAWSIMHAAEYLWTHKAHHNASPVALTRSIFHHSPLEVL